MTDLAAAVAGIASSERTLRTLLRLHSVRWRKIEKLRLVAPGLARLFSETPIGLCFCCERSLTGTQKFVCRESACRRLYGSIYRADYRHTKGRQ